MKMNPHHACIHEILQVLVPLLFPFSSPPPLLPFSHLISLSQPSSASTGLLLHRSPRQLFWVWHAVLAVRGRFVSHRKYSARPDPTGHVQVQQVCSQLYSNSTAPDIADTKNLIHYCCEFLRNLSRTLSSFICFLFFHFLSFPCSHLSFFLFFFLSIFRQYDSISVSSCFRWQDRRYPSRYVPASVRNILFRRAFLLIFTAPGR